MTNKFAELAGRLRSLAIVDDKGRAKKVEAQYESAVRDNHATILAALDRAAASDGAAGEWLLIDNAAKDGTDVLAWWPGMSLAVPCRWTGHGYSNGPGWFQMSYSSAELRCNPTHFMRMPRLPK